MANDKGSITVSAASNDAFSELEQLRLIVFGQAKAELDERIDALQNQLTNDINAVNEQFQSRMENLQSKIEEQFAKVNTTISELDHTRENDKQNNLLALEQAQQHINSQLEMTENAGKDETDALHKRVDDEVAKLETNVEESVQDLLQKLDKVSKELSNTKTDRKTLAMLLANMASNLDADNE